MDTRPPSRRLAELLIAVLCDKYGIQSARDENELESKLVLRDKSTNAYLRVTIIHDVDSFK